MLANLNKNFTQYSLQNAKYTYPKTISIFVKYSLLVAI